MSDPRLLREGTSRGFDRALLESAREDRAPEGGEDLALAALGLGAVAVTGVAALATQGASAPPAAMTVSKIASAALLKWLGISVAVTVAVSAPVAYVVVSRAERPTVEALAENAAASQARAPGPPSSSSSPRGAAAASKDLDEPAADDGTDDAGESPALAPSTLPAAPAAPAAPAVPAAPAASASANAAAHAPAPARSASSLSPELAVLDRARHALAAHDAAGARAALDEYERRFPRGSLREEADLASIETLVLSGDVPGTRAAANRFLADHPDSAYAGRVRGILKRASNP
jgi:hypothetical protein